MSLFLIGSIAAGIFFLVILIAISFRVVVPTNAVHIVQSAKRSTPYGKDMGGNTYYKWPAWLPIRIGANEASNTTFAHRQLA
jgi:flotillin